MLKEPKRIIAEEPRAPDYSKTVLEGCDPNITTPPVIEEILTTFLVSVIAGVVSYYICKWLDSRR